MTRSGFRLAVVLALGCFVFGSVLTAHATGITADAGLTAPAGRWILRSQVRYAERADDPTEMGRRMRAYAVPVVLAYGLRPEWTVIGRQVFLHRKMKMGANRTDDTGFSDFRLLAKYRMLRINRPSYTFGVAPTFGIEFPSGDGDFGSDTWDVLAGVYLSGRRGAFGADLNLQYMANGLDERSRNGTRPGDEFLINMAVAYQFTLDTQATLSWWPVLEMSYGHVRPEREAGHRVFDSGEDVLLLSPGAKFAWQSFMLEALVQIPVYRDERGNALRREIGGLLGFRYLF